MKTHFFFNLLRKNIIKFLDIFNDIQVARYNTDGTVNKYITVPIKLGPKDSIWTFNKDKKNQPVMPMIGVSFDSTMLAQERIANKLDLLSVNKNLTTLLDERILNLIPYDLNFNMSILTFSMADMDQILEQILPYFIPEIYITIGIEELDISYNAKVLLNSAQANLDLSMPYENYRPTLWDLNFTSQTYLMQPVLTTNNKLIKYIYENIYTNKTRFDNRSTLSLYTSGVSASYDESIFLEGLSLDQTTGEVVYAYEVFTGDFEGNS